MTKYGYEAINKLGKEIKGSMEGNSEEEVRYKLQNQGLTVVLIKQQSLLTQDINIQIGGYPTTRDLCVMCRQFVSMNKAGVTILETLRLLSEQTENKTMAKAISGVRTEIGKGETLADSLAKYPKVFPDIMVNMVSAGEASGKLDVAFERMATHFEKSARLKAMMKKESELFTVV